jgi:hypothetical protein
MSQALVRKIFMETLADFASKHTPVLTLSRENVAYTKPTNGATFLEVWFNPADTITSVLSADKRRFRGTCQVSVWQKEGAGAGLAETIAEELYQLFPVVPKKYLPLSIESPVTTKKAISDGTGWYVLPCLIEYRLESDT